MTLKRKVKEDRDVREREEIETEVKDVEKMREILVGLGFTKQMIMEKYRFKWVLGEVEICIDEMPFGVFVEIEGEEDEIKAVSKEMGFDLSDKITVTYWELFEEYKKRNGVTRENIQFPEGYKSVIRRVLSKVSS